MGIFVRFGYWRHTIPSAQNPPPRLRGPKPLYSYYDFTLLLYVSSPVGFRKQSEFLPDSLETFSTGELAKFDVSTQHRVLGSPWNAHIALRSSKTCINCHTFLTQESAMACSRFEQYYVIILRVHAHSTRLNSALVPPTRQPAHSPSRISYIVLLCYLYIRTIT